MFSRLVLHLRYGLLFLCLGPIVAAAAEAPYTDYFNFYPPGSMPANFVEAPDADWSTSGGAYRGQIVASGISKSVSSTIDLSNVAGKNFTFTTNFTATAAGTTPLGKIVSVTFFALGGYTFRYTLIANGDSTTTGHIQLEGGPRTLTSLGTISPGPDPYAMTLHGAYMDGTLVLTGELRSAAKTLSLKVIDPTPASGSGFGYGLSANSIINRTAGATAFFDDFSVVFPAPAPVKFGNLSTRINVGKDEAAGIAGFIVTGTAPKRVAVRGLQSGDAIDAVLELVGSDGTPIGFNDNWQDSQEEEIRTAGLSADHASDAIILATLEPGAYTAILRGTAETEATALIEVYDLTSGADSILANISTRAQVKTQDRVPIAGVIILGDGKARTMVRALGPSLAAAGIKEPLADPTLELRDENAGLVAQNDNWRDTQQAEIEASTLAPPDPAEPAIIANLFPVNYTAILRGKNDTTGVAVIELYHLK